MHDDDDHPEHFHLEPDDIIEDIEGLEMFSLRSVGIDIGSSNIRTSSAYSSGDIDTLIRIRIRDGTERSRMTMAPPATVKITAG